MILGLLIDSISFPPTPMTHQYQYQYQHHPGGGRRKPCLLSLRSSLVCSLVCWFCTIGFPPMHEGMRARRTIATQRTMRHDTTRHEGTGQTTRSDQPQDRFAFTGIMPVPSIHIDRNGFFSSTSVAIATMLLQRKRAWPPGTRCSGPMQRSWLGTTPSVSWDRTKHN